MTSFQTMTVEGVHGNTVIAQGFEEAVRIAQDEMGYEVLDVLEDPDRLIVAG